MRLIKELRLGACLCGSLRTAQWLVPTGRGILWTLPVWGWLICDGDFDTSFGLWEHSQLTHTNILFLASPRASTKPCRLQCTVLSCPTARNDFSSPSPFLDVASLCSLPSPLTLASVISGPSLSLGPQAYSPPRRGNPLISLPGLYLRGCSFRVEILPL